MKRCHFLFLLLACCLLSACSRTTRLTVNNNSKSTLSNVVASGSGFTHQIGSLAPGGSQQVTVTPRGESGLKLTFDANGKHFSAPEQGYFENGYNVSATVAPDFTYKVDAKLP
jgi:hypothetical protein